MAELAVHKGSGTTEFRKGLQAGLTIAIGYAPIAVTFGLLAKTTGLTIAETIMMSMIVFAGASQYISLSLIALGTGIMEIILTTFIVNIRHFLMSTALNEKVEEDQLWKKAIYAFTITDESFSVTAVKEGKLSTGFLLGVNYIGYVSWVLFSGAGYLMGANMPRILQESMSVALYAMFIGLLVPSMKKSIKVVILAAAAACFHTIFSVTGALSTGWAIVAATLLASVVVEFAEWMNKKRRGESYEP